MMAEKKTYTKPVAKKRVAANLVSGSKKCNLYRRRSGAIYYH
jgi:hypothetical protein